MRRSKPARPDGATRAGRRRCAALRIGDGAERRAVAHASVDHRSRPACQPAVQASASNGSSYNGEVYNYIELRAELEKRGAGFVTTSDTEVLLAALDRDGMDRAGPLRGYVGLRSFR